MKSIFLSFLFLIFTFTSWGTATQDSCKVLVEALKGNYKGGCKNGLAHGFGIAKGKDSYDGYFRKGYPNGTGTYHWTTGETYTGEWKKGKRNGKGSYTFKIEDRDTTVSGLWKDDIYAGPMINKPSVVRVHNIDSYAFKKTGGTQKRVMLNFQQNGTYNVEIKNLMLTASSGTDAKSGSLVGFDNITFPVTIVARYDTYNKLKTVKYNAYIEFTIYEEGDWEVRLTN